LKGLNFPLNSVKYSGTDVHLLLLFGKLLKDVCSPFKLFWQACLCMQRTRIRQKKRQMGKDGLNAPVKLALGTTARESDREILRMASPIGARSY
jgi:hypothetical protein